MRQFNWTFFEKKNKLDTKGQEFVKMEVEINVEMKRYQTLRNLSHWEAKRNIWSNEIRGNSNWWQQEDGDKNDTAAKNKSMAAAQPLTANTAVLTASNTMSKHNDQTQWSNTMIKHNDQTQWSNTVIKHDDQTQWSNTMIKHNDHQKNHEWNF